MGIAKHSYLGYGPEDMQQNTFTVAIELVVDAINSIRTKDLETAHANLDALYLLLHTRLDDGIEQDLEEIAQSIHGVDRDEDPEYLSEQFDKARAVMKKITKCLDDAGILLRMRTDLDKISIQG